MDLIYALYRKHSTTTKSLPECESLHDGETLCSVSSQNIVAFTTRTELDDLTAKTWGSHVYVADLNTPWYSHRVVSSPAVVTALEWDLPGSKLLIADSSGNVSLWTLKEHVLNDWVCLGTATFTGEHILGAAFFHNGKKISLVTEKKDSVLYSEKFAHVRFAPSVRQFGNRAVEGCLVISTTGMVGALAIPKEGPGLPLITATDSLGSTRHRITALDICYGKNIGEETDSAESFGSLFGNSSSEEYVPEYSDSEDQTEKGHTLPTVSVKKKHFSPKIKVTRKRQKNPGEWKKHKSAIYRERAEAYTNYKDGQLLVAVSNGNVHTPVQCYRVSVKKTDEKCIITSQALPSFFLQASPSADQHYHTVTQLKFVVREDADTLVVSANGEAGALFEVWELREKPLSVHKLFQPKAQSTELFKTVLWQHQSTFRANAQVTCITTLKVSITNTVPPPLYVIMVLADGTIHCLTRDSLKQMASAWLRVGWRDDVKHSKMSINISAMDLTWLGGALVVADTQGQLYVYRLLLPISEPGVTLSVPLATTLLEYCLVTGLDWWDILISIRPNMLDAVCDRLSESFSRQPPAVQQFHYVTYLSLKSALYRLVPAGQAKAADLTALLMLHSVATAFKSLLRPSDLASHDKGPADSLQAVMSDSIIDVDKVLLHLEAKEFTVEPSTLQSLHQLIQWVADLALNLLARLPEQRKTTGYELVRDNKAINSVRELLVIIRIWGLLRTSCLPVFVRSAENMDVLSHLFKLLSRLVQSQEPDENLIDDCILLPSQVMIPPLNTATPITAITSPALFHQALPIQLEYNVEPDCLHFVPDLNPVEGAMATDQTVDTIRHIYLGHQPLVVKQCCRCGGKAQLQSCSRTAAIRAWDQRWARACRCGGHWRVHKYV